MTDYATVTHGHTRRKDTDIHGRFIQWGCTGCNWTGAARRYSQRENAKR